MRTAITLVLLAAALVWARSRTDAFGVFFAIHASSALFYLFGMARFGALSPGSGDDSTAADRSLLLKALLYGTFINVGNNVVTLLAPYRETELGITLGQRIALADHPARVAGEKQHHDAVHAGPRVEGDEVRIIVSHEPAAIASTTQCRRIG